MSESLSKVPTIGHASLLNLTGLIIPLLLALVTIPLYLHLIGAERYGILAIVWLILGYSGMFDLGLGRAVTNHLARLHDYPASERQAVFWTALSLSVALGLVGSGLLSLLAGWLFTEVFQLSEPLRAEALAAAPWITMTPPIITTLSVLAGTLEGRQAFLALNLGQFTGFSLYVLIPLLLAIVGVVQLQFLVAATVAGRFIGGIVLFVGCTHYLPLSEWFPQLARRYIRPLLYYGSWITVSSVMGPLLTITDRCFIGAQLGMVAVTDYTIPHQLVTRISVLPQSLYTALFPKFSMQDPQMAQALMLHALLTIAVIITPLVVFTLLLLKPFLMFWVGTPLAARAAPVGEILLLGIWINALAYIPYAYLQARGRPDLTAKFHLLELLPYLLLLWLGIEFMGVVGAACAWSLRTMADALLLYYAAQGGWQQVRVLIPPALLVLLAGCVALRIPSGHWSAAGGGLALLLAGAWSVYKMPPELRVLLQRIPLLGNLLTTASW